MNSEEELYLPGCACGRRGGRDRIRGRGGGSWDLHPCFLGHPGEGFSHPAAETFGGMTICTLEWFKDRDILQGEGSNSWLMPLKPKRHDHLPEVNPQTGEGKNWGDNGRRHMTYLR